MVDDYPGMKNCFQKSSIVAYKRCKNIRDLLIRNKSPPNRGPARILNGFKKCGELCNVCILSPANMTKNHVSNFTKK